MPQLFTNNAVSLLNASVNSTDAEIQLMPGSGTLYPQPVNADDFFLVTLENSVASSNEIVKISGRQGDRLIVASNGRGWENTAPQSWNVNDLVDHRITAGTLQAFLSVTSSSENITVPPSGPLVVQTTTTGNVDSFTTTTLNRTCKWIISMIDIANDKVAMMEILAISRGPLKQPSFTRYAQVGDNFNVTINVAQIGNDLRLSVTNNSPVDLTIEIIRIHNF